MYKKFIILIISLISFSCTSIKKSTTNCSTKYPILLVHGVAYRDDIKILPYWSKIPSNLRRHGAKIYLSKQNAFNSHIDNALQIRKRIIKILEKTGAKKVNIIAHSKGGIESRYLVSRLNMDNMVASITTLATPHRGSIISDTVLSFIKRKKLTHVTVKIFNSYAKIIGDKNPNVLKAARELSNDFMKHFNQTTPNVENVYYQSYIGVVSNTYPDFFITIQEKLLTKNEGCNDGVVSLKSAKWGNFRGIVKSDDNFGVSHFDIVGMRFVSEVSTFDANKFIINIVKDLKLRGF